EPVALTVLISAVESPALLPRCRHFLRERGVATRRRYIRVSSSFAPTRSRKGSSHVCAHPAPCCGNDPVAVRRGLTSAHREAEDPAGLLVPRRLCGPWQVHRLGDLGQP